MSEDKISDEEEDDFPSDSCFTCLVSETAAEKRGFRRAITLLRDTDRYRDWAKAALASGYEGSTLGWESAADYLEAQEPS